MKIVADLHTHTIASEHAFSTLNENIQAAKKAGLSILGTTDHGPNTIGGPTPLFFRNLQTLPKSIDGIRLLKGAEANILNTNGDIDLSDDLIEGLDYLIVSLHKSIAPQCSADENTAMIINALRHPKVKIIGHPDNPDYPIDASALVDAAKQANVLIEVNNQSFVVRKGGEAQLTRILNECISQKTPVILNSDAHLHLDIANITHAAKFLDSSTFPTELIINTDATKTENFIIS